MSRADREARRARKQERLQRDAENQGNQFSSTALSRNGYQFDFFKVEREGELNLHIIPYVIGSEQHPEVVAGRMKVGDEDYFLEYAIHRNIGPDGRSSVLCLNRTYGKPCPICEHANELRDGGQSDDLPWPSRRAIYNLIDDDDRGQKIQVFEVSEKLFHDELKGKMLRSSRGVFDFSDPEEGAIVKCWASENKRGRFTFCEFKDFEFVDRDPLDVDLIDKAIPLDKLLNVPTYEEVRALYEGEITSINYGGRSAHPEESEDEPEAASEDEPEDEPEEEAPKEAPKRRRSSEKKGLEYGSECPQGLVFGKDFDTHKRKCGVDCSDRDFAACEKAHEAHK